MPLVTFHPGGRTAEVKTGTTILEAARSIGIIIESPCNGAIVCGKCKVKVDNIGNIENKGSHVLSEKESSSGYVLACGAVIKDDIHVHTLKKNSDKATKILSHGHTFNVKSKPVISKEYLENSDKTLVFAEKKMIGEENGNTISDIYGVVVDIGTTTLVASLVHLPSGVEIASVSSVNPQVVHGQDVLSRIKIASEQEGLNTLNSLIIDEINSMIDNLAIKVNVERSKIYEAVFSGNTTMLHLAVGIDPSSLGKYPYIPEISGGSSVPASENGILISPFGFIYLTPIISAYVGGDITSGILAAQLHSKKGLTLFVDIGTNGEMVISNNGRLFATSTAAGPAFEGMNIKFGMRASSGAIEYYDITEDGKIIFKTINNDNPVGICGSGLIDIVGELADHGIINKNGKLVNPEELPEFIGCKFGVEDGKTVFRICEEIYITQKDIRQVQLAKGAVRAGIEFLMSSMNVSADDVDRVYIAGSFGYHLQAKSLIHIGLLPKEFEGKIEFIGNTSQSGGHAFLINGDYRDTMQSVVKDVNVVELSNFKDFDKMFIQCMSFNT